MCTQRKKHDANKLDSARVTLLNDIGFDFTMNKPNSWDENFAELKEYYEKNGNDAKYSCPTNRRMYKW